MSSYFKSLIAAAAFPFLMVTTAPAIEYAGGVHLATSSHAVPRQQNQNGGIQQVTGIYAADGVRGDGSLDPNLLSSNLVDGFLIRLTWASLEPSEGVFAWGQLDSNIAQAAGANKTVTIAVAVGANAPNWVYTDGARSFSWVWNTTFQFPICSVQKMPLPWDSVFTAKWSTFLNAFGARYNSNPTVAGIKLSAVSSQSWETSLPVSVNKSISGGGVSCTGYDDVTDWLRAGYNRSLMESTWDNLTASFAAAFPNKQLIPMLIPAGFPPIDENGNVFSGKEHAISEHILAAGSSTYGSQFGAQNNALSSVWIWPTLETYASTIDTGYQTTKTLGSTLAAAANLAIAGGARYLELYKSDLEDPSLTSTLQSLHASLN